MTTGKAQAALTDDGVVAIGESLDEFVGIGTLGHLDDFFFAGIRFAVGNIFTNRAGKEESFLKDHTDGGAQACGGELIDVVAKYFQVAFGGLVKPKQQVDQSRFTATGLANQCDLLALAGAKAHALDNWLVFFISEGDIIECENRL